MPNWCSNYLSVLGPEEEIDRFLKAIKGQRADFSNDYPIPFAKRFQRWIKRDLEDGVIYDICFNKIIPVPLWIVYFVGFSNCKFESKVRKVIEKHKFLYPLFKLLRQNIDGYSWCCKNWGVKWDASEERCVNRQDPECVDIGFDTAWGHPDGIIKNLIKRFPKLKFDFRYDESGMFFAGIIQGTKGEVTRNDYYESEDDLRANGFEYMIDDQEEDEAFVSSIKE